MESFKDQKSVQKGEMVRRARGSSQMVSRFASQGPVVQSIVSLASLLRGQLVKCFTTLLLNIGRLRKNGGQKIDIISLLLNKVS